MSPSHQQLTGTIKSPLVEFMISGDRTGVGGILANDANGLCLIDKGNMVTTTTVSTRNAGTDASCDNSGVYTSLAKLASTLTPCQSAKSSSSSPPLITIELEGPTSILIKEYDGHTVAMRVPNVKRGDSDGD